MRRLALLILLGGCSRNSGPAPVEQMAHPYSIGKVLETLPASHPQRAHIARVAELLRALTSEEPEGMHGPHHKIDVAAEEEFWKTISAQPVFERGDHVLALALEEVYTRPHRNYYHGALWHWPYLCSRKAAALADRLLAEYPRSALAERALWLKAWALRLAPAERHPGYEDQYPVYQEQAAWKPDLEAARAVYAEIVRRFPGGRTAKAAERLAKEAEIFEPPGELLKGDPRDP